MVHGGFEKKRLVDGIAVPYESVLGWRSRACTYKANTGIFQPLFHETELETLFYSTTIITTI
jgi:hypothetical protein